LQKHFQYEGFSEPGSIFRRNTDHDWWRQYVDGWWVELFMLYTLCVDQCGNQCIFSMGKNADISVFW